MVFASGKLNSITGIKIDESMGKARKAFDAQTGRTRTNRRAADPLRSASAVEIRKRIDARAAAFRRKHGAVTLTPQNYKEDKSPRAFDS